MEYNGKYMMKNNYEGSKIYSLPRSCYSIYLCILCIYVWQWYKWLCRKPEAEEAFKLYAYSKLLFDRYVRKFEGEYTAQVVGLRYFNVFGPNEAHRIKWLSCTPNVL